MCHQTVSLVARELESAGVPTVVIGSARDTVEECGVPRFLFVDYPLGNPCGRPWDRRDQEAILGAALDLAASAVAPRTTVQAPNRWPDEEWRVRYMRVDETNRAELARAGERRRRARRRDDGD